MHEDFKDVRIRQGERQANAIARSTGLADSIECANAGSFDWG